MTNKEQCVKDFDEARRKLGSAISALIESDQRESTLELICSDIEQLNEDACEEWECITGKEPSF